MNDHINYIDNNKEIPMIHLIKHTSYSTTMWGGNCIRFINVTIRNMNL